MVSDKISFPARLSLARLATPLQPLDRLSRELGTPHRLWVKRDDLTGCTLSGNKVRKLEFTLAQALAEGADTIITCGGVQSNHCRATALLCAQLGLRCRLILRGEAAPPYDGNLLLDMLAGATVEAVAPAVYQRELESLLAAAAAAVTAAGGRPFVIPTGASDGIGVWGYVAAAGELQSDFAAADIAPRHVVCATGSGGTQAGLTAGCALHSLDAIVWGVAVCDNAAWFQRKVRADLVDWNERYRLGLSVAEWGIDVIDGYVGPGYARADTAVFATIRRLASTEGVVLDPVYTGKAFHALLEELPTGRFGDSGDVVFIHTGGVFGLFPQRSEVGCA